MAGHQRKYALVKGRDDAAEHLVLVDRRAAVLVGGNVVRVRLFHARDERSRGFLKLGLERLGILLLALGVFARERILKIIKPAALLGYSNKEKKRNIFVRKEAAKETKNVEGR